MASPSSFMRAHRFNLKNWSNWSQQVPGVVLSPNGVLKIQSAALMPNEIFPSLRTLLLELAS